LISYSVKTIAEDFFVQGVRSGQTFSLTLTQLRPTALPGVTDDLYRTQWKPNLGQPANSPSP